MTGIGNQLSLMITVIINREVSMGRHVAQVNKEWSCNSG